MLLGKSVGVFVWKRYRTFSLNNWFSKVQFIQNWNRVYHRETGGASDVAWQLWILLCRFQRFLIPWLLVSSREYDDMISMILSCKIWQYLWWFFVSRSCFCFVFANDNFTKKKQENCPNQIMVFFIWTCLLQIIMLQYHYIVQTHKQCATFCSVIIITKLQCALKLTRICLMNASTLFTYNDEWFSE